MANHEADIQNPNRGTDGTNRTYDQNQGNRGKQMNPNQQFKNVAETKAAIQTIESMLGIDEKKEWTYQRLEESIEKVKGCTNELTERERAAYMLGVMELIDGDGEW